MCFHCCCTFCLLICHVIVIILYFLKLILFLLSFVNCIPVHLWMSFRWYSFIITFWGYFVILEGCFFYNFNVLFFSDTLLLYLSFFLLVFLYIFIYFYLLHTWLSLSLLRNQLLKMSDSELPLKTKSKENWKADKLERLSLSQCWSTWRSIKFFGVDLGNA